MRRRAGLILALVLVQTAIYWTLNHYPPVPSRTLPLTPLDEWIPFVVWTIWPYLALIATEVVLPVLITDPRIFMRYLRAYVLALTGAFACYALVPTHVVRPAPPTDDSLSAWAYRCLIAADTPECACPSGHVLIPELGCLALLANRHPLARPITLAVNLCLPTVLTTKQHYVWDVLAALLWAGVCWWLAGRVGSRQQLL
jgi:hypothetical protein